jgi:acetyl esterase/lipase
MMPALKPRFANQTYSTKSSSNILDVYLPETGKAPFPLVLFIHGGAFMHGDKERPEALADFLAAGFAVASLNYRLSGQAIWPAQLNDIKAALMFLRSNTNRLMIDGQRIAVFGPSAGGFLAAVVALSLAVDPASQIKACVDWYGPVDFGTMDQDMEDSGIERASGRNDGPESPESKLLGVTVRDHPDIAAAASPLAFLGQLPAELTPPPFLIMHGSEDPLIAPKQSERLRDALREKYGEDACDYYLLEEGGHGGSEFDRPEIRAIVIDFLNRHL